MSWRGWVEPQGGLGDEAVEDAGVVLEALGSVADQDGEPVHGGRGEIRQAALDVGPRAFSRIQSGA
jgi:hypothetical protein